jgi:hypothetical protein
LAVRGSVPSSPIAEPEPSVRDELDRVAAHTAAFLCFTVLGHQRVEPLFPDAFTVGPPLAVGEHRVSPISCGARPSSRGCVSSLVRSPPCPWTPPRRRACAGDADHQARLGNRFLQVAQPLSTCAQPTDSLRVYPHAIASAGMPAVRAHSRASPLSRAARFGPVRALGAHARTYPSSHAHAHAHAHAPRGLAFGRPRPELAAGLLLCSFEHAHACTRNPAHRHWLSPAAPPSVSKVEPLRD